MLKIKDEVDLKELEKFGFEENDGEYYYDFMKYTPYESSYLCIDFDRKVLTGYVVYEHIDKMTDLIFDLIQAGFVEKVVEDE